MRTVQRTRSDPTATEGLAEPTDDKERPVAGRLQRRVPNPLLIERVHVVGKGSVRLDSLTRLLVESYLNGAPRSVPKYHMLGH